MDNINLSVIIPAYHEEENLRVLIPRLISVLQKFDNVYEVIIVDIQKSLDNTKDLCKEFDIVYVQRENSNSFGDAIRTGIKNASGKYLLFMDADGSHTPEFIPKLYSQKDNCDIVIASRYVPGGYTENIKILVWMSKIVNIIYKIVLNMDCHDISNNFKLYRAELFTGLSFNCHNFDIVEEILYKICKQNKNLKIIEVPFSFKKRMFGETKRNLFVFMFSYVLTLLKLKFGK